MSSPLGYPREARLVKSFDFQRIQKGGRRIRTPSLLILYLPGQHTLSRFGLTVSRKVGKAVIRNRVKRLLREAIRHTRPQIQGIWDVVVVAHPVSALQGFEVLSQEVQNAVLQLGRKRI